MSLTAFDALGPIGAHLHDLTRFDTPRHRSGHGAHCETMLPTRTTAPQHGWQDVVRVGSMVSVSAPCSGAWCSRALALFDKSLVCAPASSNEPIPANHAYQSLPNHHRNHSHHTCRGRGTRGRGLPLDMRQGSNEGSHGIALGTVHTANPCCLLLPQLPNTVGKMWFE